MTRVNHPFPLSARNEHFKRSIAGATSQGGKCFEILTDTPPYAGELQLRIFRKRDDRPSVREEVLMAAAHSLSVDKGLDLHY